MVNWSLSEATLRLVIKVGVAYGSDTQRVAELLHKAADEHPRVLAEPHPDVIFSAFGASSLDFELRVFIPNPDFLPVVLHELHMDIDRRFREAGIEIAFPQQDLHIRTLPLQLTGALIEARGNHGSQTVNAKSA